MFCFFRLFYWQIQFSPNYCHLSHCCLLKKMEIQCIMFLWNIPGWKKFIAYKDLLSFSSKIFQVNAFFCKTSCIFHGEKLSCNNLQGNNFLTRSSKKSVFCKDLARSLQGVHFLSTRDRTTLDLIKTLVSKNWLATKYAKIWVFYTWFYHHNEII